MLFAYFLTNQITAILNLSLGIFVYLKNKNNIVNRTFALMNICIAIWAFGFAMAITAPNKTLGFFWILVLNIGATGIPLFFLHFVFAILKIGQKEKKKLIIAYILNSFILILNFTPLFHRDVTPKLSFKYYSVPGPLYFLYIIMLLSYINYGLYRLFKGYKTAVGIFQNQIKYIIIACVVGFSGASTTFLPLFGVKAYRLTLV